MSLEDGTFSLIIECNLENLGFIRVHNTVVANAGLFFIRPLGLHTVNHMEDDLHGFQIAPPKEMMEDFLERKRHLAFASTAKIAIRKCLAS